MSEDTAAVIGLQSIDKAGKMPIEVAEAEFARFIDAMDLDVEVDFMDSEEERDFTREKRIFLRAVQAGNLVVDDEGRPVYTPKLGNTEPLVFNEYDGAALMASDGAKKGKDISKSYRVMASITKQTPARFARMKGRDLKVCTAIMLFLTGG